MSAKQARKIRKEYKKAGAIYWTLDMEREIKKIHKERSIYRTASIIMGVIAIAEAITIIYSVVK